MLSSVELSGLQGFQLDCIGEHFVVVVVLTRFSLLFAGDCLLFGRRSPDCGLIFGMNRYYVLLFTRQNTYLSPTTYVHVS